MVMISIVLNVCQTWSWSNFLNLHQSFLNYLVQKWFNLSIFVYFYSSNQNNNNIQFLLFISYYFWWAWFVFVPTGFKFIWSKPTWSNIFCVSACLLFLFKEVGSQVLLRKLDYNYYYHIPTVLACNPAWHIHKALQSNYSRTVWYIVSRFLKIFFLRNGFKVELELDTICIDCWLFLIILLQFFACLLAILCLSKCVGHQFYSNIPCLHWAMITHFENCLHLRVCTCVCVCALQSRATIAHSENHGHVHIKVYLLVCCCLSHIRHQRLPGLLTLSVAAVAATVVTK